ncbi:MAG: hypothetical protein M3O50_07605 [Myxococcota bacterium]|nr:hypothetical protein [Myxococcota bacterium]
MTALRVLIDGASLPDAEARALWKRFSDWMEEHPGDLGGFASAEGLASVHPEMQGSAPVLVGSHTAAQRPYTAVTAGGSPADAGRSDRRAASSPPPSAGKRGQGGSRRRRRK